jgi:hypothetical protein
MEHTQLCQEAAVICSWYRKIPSGYEDIKHGVERLGNDRAPQERDTRGSKQRVLRWRI